MQKEKSSEPLKQQLSSRRRWQTLLTIIVVVAALATAYFLGTRKRSSRLDGFAKCLQSKNIKMYGLYWCTHCAEQKELFGSAFQYVPYIECGVKGSRDEEPGCAQANLKQFPTWQFSDGSRTQGMLPLTSLSEKTGCALP
ncbi:MAG: hypothetical protein ABJA69_03720 [Acidobacteriaceae bacterium]